MDKTQLVKNWVYNSGADKQFADKRQAFALGWKLLNDYLNFQESGQCPETQAPLYDFTQFIDTFADLYSGADDGLYTWIVNNGHTIIDAIHNSESLHKEIPNAHCPLCSVPLYAGNVARDTNGQVRKSAAGRAWCKECARKMDEKDWKITQ